MEKTETEYDYRTVVTGPTSGNLVKIHEGLKAGERVVVKGAVLPNSALEKHLSLPAPALFDSLWQR